MIEGLHADVPASELKGLLEARASHHEERAGFYAAQAAALVEGNAEKMEYTNGDPIRALKEKGSTHEQEAQEMKFIAEHLSSNEIYRLDRSCLQRLGIAKDRW